MQGFFLKCHKTILTLEKNQSILSKILVVNNNNGVATNFIEQILPLQMNNLMGRFAIFLYPSYIF